MGDSPLQNPKLKEVLSEINEMVGWTAIKKSIDQVIEICKKNYEKEMLGQKTLPIMLNRIFLGNPGTGKTTCAVLYGRLLKELNILSVGDVVMASTSDLVGSVVGESQRKTNEMLEKARGKVLVIDEAYNLDGPLFGKQVNEITSLLIEMFQIFFLFTKWRIQDINTLFERRYNNKYPNF